MTSEFRTQMIWKFSLIAALTIGSAVALRMLGMQRGLDLKGGTELQYVIRTGDLRIEQKSDVTQRTIDIIRQRVDPTGVMEMDIRSVGVYRFAIRLPGMGVDQAKAVEDRIQRSGRLLFCLLDEDNDPAIVRDHCTKASLGMLVSGTTPFVLDERPDPNGQGRIIRRWRKADFRDLPTLKLAPEDWMNLDRPDFRGADRAILVKSQPAIEGDKLDTSAVKASTAGGKGIEIEFKFLAQGTRTFAYITENNKGKHLAIILDNILYSAPVIQTRISGPGVITGGDTGFDPAEADDLVKTLRAGSLPADIELEWRHSIGPDLGEDSIRAGITASVVGLALVIILMLGYYLLSGVIAIIAIVLDALLVLAVMALFGTTMTLPGIAGLILTLGMAVDANVLILERLREEKARGKTLRLAISNAYDRAFVTIIDTNLTTLITALILYFVGTGPVKGFALVLSIGIIASIFTSVFVTRAINDLLIGINAVSTLPMLQLFRRTQISFTKVRYVAISCSALLAIAGMIVFVARGDRKYDSDLLGGFMAEMELKSPMSTQIFRERVAKAGYPRASVQSLWASGVSGGENATLFSIRVAKLDQETMMAKIEDDIRARLEAAGILKQLTRTVPWTYTVSASSPITETDLRAQFKTARYQMQDIVEILPVNVTDNQFAIHVGARGMDLEQTTNAVQEVQKALRTIVATRVRTFTPGKIESKQDVNGQGTWTLNLAFSESVPRDTLEATLKEIIPGAAQDPAFAVSGAGRDEGADICLNVRVEAKDRPILDRILGRAAEPLSMPSILHQKDNPKVFEIETSAPMSEEALRAKLGDDLCARIQAVIPEAAAASEFVVTMSPQLSEEKFSEKIRADLQQEFRSELAQRLLNVEFKPMDSAPGFVRHPEDLVRDGYALLEMDIKEPATNVSAEVPVQVIADNLRNAGFEDALLLAGPLRELAQTTTPSAYLKYKPAVTPRETFEREVRAKFTTPQAFRRVEAVGGQVSHVMKNSAFWATVLSIIAMLIYIWVRFGELRFGIGAVIALVHDVIIMLGAVAVADALADMRIGAVLGFSELKINLVMIGAFLTLVGYSVNDTIVVFDRIRENMGGRRGKVDPKVVDDSINQTLSRTVLTSLTVLIVVVCLYFLGGPVLHGFAFVLSLGVIVGTYSSIFIASPIMLDWPYITGFVRKVFRIVTFRTARRA